MRQGRMNTTERRRTARRIAGHTAKEADEMWAKAPWFGPYTVEEINEDLDQAEAEEEAGLGTPHETFMKEMADSLNTTSNETDKELESCKLAAIQGIANAESLEDVYWVLVETQSKLMQKWKEEAEKSPLPPYTMEELNARIDRAEADIAAGRVYTCEEVHRMMEEKFPWLK